MTGAKHVFPSLSGGVAIAGQEGLPEGHATTKDKILGNIDKVRPSSSVHLFELPIDFLHDA